MVKWISEDRKRLSGPERACFVISPIGEDQSELRKHANAVHEFIIAPAFALVEQEKGIRLVPARADHKLHHGNIVSEVINHILRDELIIAVLSFARHNVYYELGIAHAAGRRPILLLVDEQKQDLPFDISQESFIDYSYDPVSLKSGAAARRLADAIKGMLDEQKSSAKPFGREIKEFKPFGGEHAHLRFFPTFRDLKIEEWLSMIDDASRFVAICEPELAMTGSLPEGDLAKFIAAIQKKAAAGVRVSLIYSPATQPVETHASKKQLADFEKKQLFIERMKDELKSATAINWVEVSGEKDSDCYLLTDEGCLLVRGTLAEKPFGTRTTFWVSSQPDTEFSRLYAATQEDLRNLSVRNGGGEIEGDTPRGPGTALEPRLAVFRETLQAIRSARRFVMILEPAFALCSPSDQEGDDAAIRYWREELRKALGARGLERGFNVVLISYDPRNPIFFDEVVRAFSHLTPDAAVAFAKETANAWQRIRQIDIEKLPMEERGRIGNWAIGMVSNAVISERIVITDSMLLAIPLIGRIGHEICASVQRDKASPEYDRMLNHALSITSRDKSAADATRLLAVDA